MRSWACVVSATSQRTWDCPGRCGRPAQVADEAGALTSAGDGAPGYLLTEKGILFVARRRSADGLGEESYARTGGAAF